MQSGNGHERSLRFDLESVGRPQPWIVHHRGLEYRGEVIVSDEVGPSWGEPLEDGVSFRVVFFMVPRRIPRGRIQDRRIGMAVPVRPPPRDASSIQRRTMENRERQLLGQFARSYKSVYIQGRIYSHEEVTVRPRDVFAEDMPESWADAMAAELLLQAFPSLPLDYGEFPHVLTSGSAADVYDGLFKRKTSAVETAADFAPGLGLALPENPDVFDASDCAVVSMMHRDLRSGGGVLPAQDLLKGSRSRAGSDKTPGSPVRVGACEADSGRGAPCPGPRGPNRRLPKFHGRPSSLGPPGSGLAFRIAGRRLGGGPAGGFVHVEHRVAVRVAHIRGYRVRPGFPR